MQSSVSTRLLPSSDGENGWYQTLPAPRPSTPLQGAVKADWAVLGAGLAGLAAARRLAELAPDKQIVLIDAVRVGFGAAGRNSGFLVDLPHDLTSNAYAGKREQDLDTIALNREAISYLRDIVKANNIDCDWREQGKIHGAVKPHGIRLLEQFGASLGDLSEPFKLLNAADMEQTTGTRYYAGGLYAPGCVLVQPAALCRGLAAALPDNVTLYEDSPVTHIEFGKTQRLVTANGEIEADQLILANNAYLTQFGLFRGSLLPIYTYGSMTRQLMDAELQRLGGDESWGLIPSDPLGSTVRRLASGRICVRNSVTFNPKVQATRANIKAALKSHQRSFERRFPMLKGVDLEYTWGGALCMTRNHGTVFGEMRPGVYAAVCQNGLGLTHGTISGKLVAELALGQDSPSLRLIQKEPKPKENPPQPFLSIGVKGALRFKEWQAGLEK
ncbi:MAG: glycine/D-amino acid oxidase-like deaminating enzyme [Motiliproteus sp.]|jgi:glycine/D-amino acid oxidase-like deaminating enzyme